MQYGVHMCKYAGSSLATVKKKRIILKFLNFLYTDYHSWTYITTNFQYHSRSFDIRNAS